MRVILLLPKLHRCHKIKQMRRDAKNETKLLPKYPWTEFGKAYSTISTPCFNVISISCVVHRFWNISLKAAKIHQTESERKRLSRRRRIEKKKICKINQINKSPFSPTFLADFCVEIFILECTHL